MKILNLIRKNRENGNTMYNFLIYLATGLCIFGYGFLMYFFTMPMFILTLSPMIGMIVWGIIEQGF